MRGQRAGSGRHTAARPSAWLWASAPQNSIPARNQGPRWTARSQWAPSRVQESALSCFNVSGGFGGGQGAGLGALVWLVLCEPVAIVVGGTIGGVSAYSNRVEPAVRMPDDLRAAVMRSTPTAQNDQLKALENRAANGISTVSCPASLSPPAAMCQPDTPRLSSLLPRRCWR